jgi:hypothetical protein
MKTLREQIVYYEEGKTKEGDRVNAMWYYFGLPVVCSIDDIMMATQTTIVTNFYGAEQIADKGL